MAATIGIKIANGEFYSIIEENSEAKKRLILTTVHDNQISVQIDLYKSYTRSMADALYIGSIVVEDLKPRAKGEPSVELIISSTAGGDISADAVDLDASARAEHYHLSVSLKSFEEDNRDFDIPDFELEQHEPPPQGLYGKASIIKEQETQKPFPWIILIIAGLALIILSLALWFFLFRTSGDAPAGSPRPSTSAPAEPRPAAPPTEPAVPAAQPAAPPSEPAVPAAAQPAAQPAVQPVTPPPSGTVPAEPESPRIIQAPAVPAEPAEAPRRSRPEPPVASYQVPTTIPREGVPYRIRWGDTLWDISEAFYRNPWLYPRIARFNNIRNPDLIISGRTIRIPPRN